MLKEIFASYRHRTITRDLASRLAFALGFLLLVLGLFNFYTTFNRQREQLETQIEEVANSLETIVAVPLWNLDIPTIRKVAEGFEQIDEIEAVYIADNKGLEFYGDLSTMNDGLVLERTIFYREQEIGLVQVKASRQSLIPIQRNILLSTLGSMVVTITAVFFLTAFLLQRYLSEPITNLQEGIDHLASGDYKYRFAPVPQVELNAIIKQINHMASEIEERDRRLESQVGQRTVELADRVDQLALLNQVGRKSNSILQLDDLLPYLVETIRQTFNYYITAIFLFDPHHRELLHLKAVATDQLIDIDLSNEILSMNAKGVIIQVANTGEFCLLSDVNQADNYMPVEFLPDTQSELAIPLRVGHKILGVLDLQSRYKNGFSETDVQVLQTLSDQVAVTVRNAQLYQIELERRHQAEALEEAGRQLSSHLEWESLPQYILQELLTLFDYQHATLILYQQDDFVILAHQGYPSNYDPIITPSERRFYNQMIVNPHPILIDEVSPERGWQDSGATVFGSWLAVPLLTKNQVLGILTLTQARPHAFNNNHRLLISTFASQTAIALENAGLYDQISRFNDQLEKTVAKRTKQLSAAYHNLERLDKSKTAFIEVMAHELRTPLTVVTGYAQMLQMTNEDEEVRHFINGIEDGGKRLHTIIDGMLDVFKIDNKTLYIRPKPLEVAPIFKKLRASLFKDLEMRRLTLDLVNLETLPIISVDIQLFEKLFYHLILNAIKYTPDGGEITINGRFLPHTTPPTIQISITDSGIGIDPEHHQLIFEKFYQMGKVALHSSGKTKFKGGGPGLGLAIAKGIVSVHHGHIWVESTCHDEDNLPGSTFFVQLPVDPIESNKTENKEGV